MCTKDPPALTENPGGQETCLTPANKILRGCQGERKHDFACECFLKEFLSDFDPASARAQTETKRATTERDHDRSNEKNEKTLTDFVHSILWF